MKYEYSFQNVKGMHFYSRTPSGHDIHIDASKDIGGSDTGARPMEYMFAGLAGCTGVDIVMILSKMHVEYDSFDIKIFAERREEEPKIYTNINIVYEFKGKDIPLEKVERAAKLSYDKYCTAIATFRGTAEVTYEIKIN